MSRPVRIILWIVAVLFGLILGAAYPFLFIVLVPLAAYAVYRQRPLSRGKKIATGAMAVFTALWIIGSVAPRPAPTTAALTAPATPSPALAPAPTPAPVPPPAPPAAPRPAPLPPQRPAGDPVTRVIDGDTFVVASGRTIRVLGIDSCESGTPAGAEATATANRLLGGATVTLRVERGIGTDRYDRDLRYVELPDARDFGTRMVVEDHTAIYAGRNDASASYLRTLRAEDSDGRTCGEAPAPAPAPTTTAEAVPDVDVDVDAPNPDLPNPPRPRPGRVGRDGDGDGLCNESTVPVPC